MPFTANHHSHTSFSDGVYSPEQYLLSAIRQNLKVYGFSDHAPLPIEGFGAMSPKKLPEYLAEIDRLKEEYQDQIQIYKGLEVDYIPGVIDMNTDYIKEANLDFSLGAVHYVGTLANGLPWGFQSSHANFQKGLDELFDGDIEACIRQYYQLIRDMVKLAPPTIVAHLDRVKKLNEGDRYFSEDDKWYQEEVALTLETISRAGIILEINTKGYYNKITSDTYPSQWILAQAKDMNIPVHIGSDAHKPRHIIAGFDYAIDSLQKLGFRSTRILLNGHWQDMPLNEFALFPVS